MRSWIDGRQRPRLLGIGLCVLLAHGALLTQATGRHRHGAVQAPPAVVAFQVVAARRPPPAAAGLAAGVPVARPAVPRLGEPTQAARSPLLRTSDAGSDPPPAARPPELAYVPRRLLDLPPMVVGAIDIPFPQLEGLVDQAIDVDLFIDERGVVRRVDVQTRGVHEAFLAAVTGALFDARFTPGAIRGVPVRSIFRMQVHFRS